MRMRPLPTGTHLKLRGRYPVGQISVRTRTHVYGLPLTFHSAHNNDMIGQLRGRNKGEPIEG